MRNGLHVYNVFIMPIWIDLLISSPFWLFKIIAILILLILAITVISWFNYEPVSQHNSKLVKSFVLLDILLLILVIYYLPITYFTRHFSGEICSAIDCLYGYPAEYVASLNLAIVMFWVAGSLALVGNFVALFLSRTDTVKSFFYKHLIYKWLFSLFLTVLISIYIEIGRYFHLFPKL